jgi:hypothetical protein
MFSLLLSSVLAQTSAPVSIPSGLPTTTPTVPPACQTYLEAQSKGLETTCGSNLPSSTTNVQIQQLVQSLNQVCSKECVDGINAFATRAASAPECSGVSNISELVAMTRLATSVACIRTSDGKGYCLAEQLKLIPEISGAADPTALIAQNLNNLKLVCTDCFQRQLKAVLESGAFPAESLSIVQGLDRSLADTCRANGGITTLGGSGTATNTSSGPTKTNNAMAMSGMGAFIGAAALLL